MSGMILCRTKRAKKPLHLNSVDINIYSLEELCYYIYNNIYLIGTDLIDSELIDFIRDDTGEKALADRLDYLIKNRAGLAEMIVTILKYVDYYNIGEIEEIKGILETLGTQNVFERIKSRADSFLGNNCYYSAIQNYYKIINGSPDTSLTGVFYAKVYHNMGVAYARMFMYRQAAFFFREAYKVGQHEESGKCMIAALRMAKGEEVIEREDATEDEYVVKREIETLMDNARYSDEFRKLQEIEKLKDDGHVAEYYNAINDFMNVWKKKYVKYTS